MRDPKTGGRGSTAFPPARPLPARWRRNGSPSHDHTGLSSAYEIDLNVEMDPEQMKRVPQPGVVFNSFGYAPGVFDAVAKLGLKLESAKEPVDIIVIDHVEKPGAN